MAVQYICSLVCTDFKYMNILFKDALNWSKDISKDINNVIKHLYLY